MPDFSENSAVGASDAVSPISPLLVHERLENMKRILQNDKFSTPSDIDFNGKQNFR